MRFMELFRRTFADINLENLVHNWNLIKTTAGRDRFICPMIKADAYGHGAHQVAFALEREGAKVFGVCLVEEGLALRSSGVKSEILVFKGFDKRGAEKMLEYQLTPVVSSFEQIEILNSVADEPVKVHIKFNTGMMRLGFEINQAEKIKSEIMKSKKLKLKGVLSHLSSSEDCLDSAGTTEKQLKLFSELLSVFGNNVVYHCLNTGAIQGLAELAGEAAGLAVENSIWGFRPGLMLYGYSAKPDFTKLQLKPVMSVKSVINNVRKIKRGDAVSYGGRWVAGRDSLIGVVPIGYADGVHRSLSNRGSFLVDGVKAPIVGSVCMDFVMLDLTDLSEMKNKSDWENHEVTVFGFDDDGRLLSADETARHANTISWEVLTSISSRVPRHYKGLIKS